MNKLKIIAFAIACASASFAYAEEPMCRLYPATTNISALSGEQFNIVFNMDNTILPSSYQVFIEGPEGVTVAKNKKGKYLVTYTDRLDPEVYTTNCMKGENQNANRFVVIDYVSPEFLNTESEEWYIQPGNGPLFTVTMQVSESVEPGNYVIAVTRPKVMTRDEVAYESPDVNINLLINVETGIESVSTDDSTITEYYTLQGISVGDANLKPGIYICRRGNKVEKLIVR